MKTGRTAPVSRERGRQPRVRVRRAMRARVCAPRERRDGRTDGDLSLIHAGARASSRDSLERQRADGPTAHPPVCRSVVQRKFFIPLDFETGPDQNSRSKSRVRMHDFAGATYIKRALNNRPRSAHHTRAPRVTRRDACARRVHTHTPCPHLHLRGAYDPSRRPSRRFVLGPPRDHRGRGVPSSSRPNTASTRVARNARARRRVRANAASDARASSSRRAAASSGVSGEEPPRADRDSATSPAEGSRSSDARGDASRVSFVTFRSVAPRATSAASTSSGGGVASANIAGESAREELFAGVSDVPRSPNRSDVPRSPNRSDVPPSRNVSNVGRPFAARSDRFASRSASSWSSSARRLARDHALPSPPPRQTGDRSGGTRATRRRRHRANRIPEYARTIVFVHVVTVHMTWE